ncbi:MAG: GNAT family N-acetyltransferase [Spirochaetales bacterium]|jgi:ribosomal protein S18 acetylase RimI-like enzyme|nr:GNAT family N-acetyltransferase [Spirochaetales bacterium]
MKGKDSGLAIRAMQRKDREPVLDILRRSGMFTGEELDVAQELIDIWLDRPEQKDYIIFTAVAEDGVAGYVCFGPTPATETTWDLYWIAVSPELQGRGVGGKLLSFAEKEIAARRGRMIIIETSSTERYRPTRDFYEKKGYVIEARVRDFYRAGDDRLIYTRRILIP